MEQLPIEILIKVFSLLEPEDLETASLVCRRWNAAFGDPVWKQMFVEMFGTLDMTPIASSHGPICWHREIALRCKVLNRWAYRKMRTVSFNPCIGMITNLQASFRDWRAIAYSDRRCTATNFELPKNLTAKFKSYGTYTTGAVAIDGSRFGLLCAFPDNRIELLMSSKRGLYAYKTIEHKRDALLTCAWLSKREHPTKHKGIACASGGQDGSVVVTTGVDDQNLFYAVSRSPIAHITCSGDTAVTLDKNYALQHIESGTARTLADLTSFLHGDARQSITQTRIYVVSGYVIVKLESQILRISLDDGSAATFAFRDPDSGPIVAFGVDHSPADGQKYLCAAHKRRSSESLALTCWVLESKPQNADILPAWQHVDIMAVGLCVTPVVVVTVDALGQKAVYDTLSGSHLRNIATPFSKTSLGLPTNPYAHPGLVVIDEENFGEAAGLIAVGPAVQFFTTGRYDSRDQSKKKTPKWNKSGRRSSFSHADIDADVEEERARQALPVIRIEEYVIGDMMQQEDQLAYALSVSQDDQQLVDDDLRQALELSRREIDSTTESLAAVIPLPSQSGPGSDATEFSESLDDRGGFAGEPVCSDAISDDQFERDLAQALALSLSDIA